MDDVAIIGVGCTRSDGSAPKSAIDMGADAIRAALDDAGVEWADVQFAFGGSFEVDNPDAVTSRLGPHRHPVHGRLQRLRHRGHRAAAGRRLRSGRASTTSASRSAWTSTPPAPSPPTPSTTARRPGTARSATSSRPSSSP